MWDHSSAHGCIDDTHPRPPLTRGLLSDSEAGGENCKAFFSPSVTASPRHLPHQREALCRSIQHILDKDSVTTGGIIDKDMGHSAHQFAVLDDGTSAHADVK